MTSSPFRILPTVSSSSYNYELCSSSFTFGNGNEFPFLSLNHDLLAIFNVDTLRWLLNQQPTAQVIVAGGCSCCFGFADTGNSVIVDGSEPVLNQR